MPLIKVSTHPLVCVALRPKPIEPPLHHPAVGMPEGPPQRLFEPLGGSHVGDPQLPTLEEITRHKCPTMKVIPGRHKDRWGRQLGTLLAAAVHFNDDAHWVVLAMFAKCTLYTSHRGGKKYKTQTNAERVSAALDLYEAKRYAEAWKAAKGPARKARAPAGNANTMERRVAQCVAQTRDAEYSRALAGLQSADLAPPSDATLRLLLGKHPKSLRGVALEAEPPPHKDVDEETVFDAICSFPRGSSGGNWCLRAEHVRAAVSSTTATGVLRAVTAMVNHLQAGRAPRSLAPFLAGAKLSAFEKKGAKPGTDARPIAAGEFFRRLVSKCMCAKHAEFARAHFSGLQYGVAVQAGGERIIHRMRVQLTLHDGDPDWVTLKVDLANAFNSVSRARALELVLAHCPDMYAWVAWCYQDVTHLVFHDHVVASAEGVQQGDPLGPLLFSLVVHELVTRIHAECPELDLHAWYLDDGAIAGPTAAVRRALKIIHDYGPDNGLNLNLGKCELISCRGNLAPLDIFPAEIPASKRRSDGCMSLLGAAMGTDTFTQEFFSTEVQAKADKALACLGSINDTQIAHTLMRQCTGFGATVFAIRTTPPHALGETTQTFDTQCEAATEEHIMAHLNPRSWVQVRHRVAASGMGVRSAHIHREAAYIASVLFAAKNDEWDPNLAPGIREAITVYNGKVAPLAALQADPLTIIQQGPLPTQHDLSLAIDDWTWKGHLETANEFQRLRLVAEAGPHAGAWLNSVPSKTQQTAFTSQEWTTQCRWWLGEPVYPEAFPCPACGQDNDVHGYHALTCAKWGDRIAKHTSLCKEAARVAHTAFLHPQAERNVGPAGTNHRDADVLLRVWELGLPLAMDFAVTHTQQPSNCTHAGLRPAGSWATEYARLHKSAGRDRCAATNTPFAAMVVEVFGVWSPEAFAFLLKMARFVARHTGIETHVAAKQLFSRMSSILQRCNVRAILSRANPNRAREDDPLFAEQWPCRVDDVVVENGAGDSEDEGTATWVERRQPRAPAEDPECQGAGPPSDVDRWAAAPFYSWESTASTTLAVAVVGRATQGPGETRGQNTRTLTA